MSCDKFAEIILFILQLYQPRAAESEESLQKLHKFAALVGFREELTLFAR